MGMATIGSHKIPMVNLVQPGVDSKYELLLPQIHRRFR